MICFLPATNIWTNDRGVRMSKNILLNLAHVRYASAHPSGGTLITWAQTNCQPTHIFTSYADFVALVAERNVTA